MVWLMRGMWARGGSLRGERERACVLGVGRHGSGGVVAFGRGNGMCGRAHDTIRYATLRYSLWRGSVLGEEGGRMCMLQSRMLHSPQYIARSL